MAPMLHPRTSQVLPMDGLCYCLAPSKHIFIFVKSACISKSLGGFRTCSLPSANLSRGTLSFSSASNTITAVYDLKYDLGAGKIVYASCSNSFKTKYPTLASLPKYPYVGGYKDAACGSCWEVVNMDKRVYVVSVDHASTDFYVSKGVMDALTENGSSYNTLPVQVTSVDKYYCGL